MSDAIAESCPDLTIDWEPGDENWVRLLSGAVVEAYLNVLVPLIIGKRRILEVCKQFSPPKYLEEIEIEDIDLPEFVVDPELLSSLSGGGVSGNLDYNRLSARDIWWVTVT